MAKGGGEASGVEAGAREPASQKEWDAIEARLRTTLASSNLNNLTTKAVRKQLEAEFAVALGSEKSKEWIKCVIEAYVAEDAGADVDEPASKKRKAAAPAKKRAPAAAAGDDGGDDVAEDPSHPPLSEEMAAIVGVGRANRFRLVKLLWIYIKKHDLQDPNDKRFIDCDAKLQRAFGQARVSAFSMSKFLGRHLLPKEEDGDVAYEAKPAKPAKPTKPAQPAKPAKSRSGGARAPAGGGGYTGSSELAAFVGEGITNNRFAITKVLWAYIKAHNLQDPSDKRRIVCDATLKALFKVDEMTAFSLSKHLSAHFPPKQ
jgi:upstream activation factor subunit UAF30